MSLDLYQDETRDRLADLRPVSAPETSKFDGFVRGTGIFAMKGIAKTGRAIDMLGSVGPIVQDAISGGTEAQDRYFKEHDEVYGSAVDYWTPKPNEVGVAAEIAGAFIGQLPLIVASPHLAVGAQVLDTAEDLIKQGVDAKKAVATGIVQGAGLATGIWMPILGRNLWERALLGGAGFNVAQGIATRAASELILEGTPAAKAFETFDPKALTLDALMGMAFGSLAHLSPASREHGAKVVNKIMEWMQERSPSEVGAITTLRTAQHLNEDSAPGKPVEAADIEAHAGRMRQAIDQMAKDQTVEVSDLPAAESKPDTQRFTIAARRTEALEKVGESVRKEEGIDAPPEHIEKPAAVEPQAETKTEAPAGQPLGAEPPPPRGPSEGTPAGAEALAPERVKADMQERRFAYLPKQAEHVKYNIDRMEQEIPAIEADASRVVSKGDKVGANNKKDAAEILKRKMASLDEARVDLADIKDMIATGRRPHVPDWEVEFAIDGMRKDAGNAVPADKTESVEASPLELEGQRIAAEQPDLRIVVGHDADGEPIVKSAKDFLAEADAQVKNVEEEASLIRAAATCLLGIA